MKIEKITERTFEVFKYFVLAYLIVSAYYFISLPTGGDESLFVSDLQLIKNIGWYGAIVKHISIPYMLLSYPLSLFVENFIALRIVNIFLFLVLLGYFKYISKIESKAIYFYLLFFVSTIGYFYFGTNDSLFFVGLIVFLNEVNNATKYRNINFNLALTALIIAFFTRELFVVYLPIIVIGLYILYNSGCRFSKKSLIPIGLFLFFILFNIPSLEKNRNLSFDKKSPPAGIGATWSQRQYLAQLMVNKEELENGQHPSWEETVNYIQINGKDSLPDGILNGITSDFKLTITEFFKDFADSFFKSFRSLGLMLVFTLGYWFRSSIKNKKMDFQFFVPFATLLMLMIFSFIIISYVELRWLMAVFIMTVVYYSEIEFEKKISNYLVLSNYIILCLFSAYGIFRILNKI